VKNNILINLIVIFLLSSNFVSSQTISDEAGSHFDLGFASIETAKSNSDFESALLEFENAARLAPEWSDVYYNLGFLQEKLGKPYDAIRNLKRYLELSPGADDRREVEKHIAQLAFTTKKEMKIKLRKYLIKTDREELLSSDNPDKKDLIEALTNAAFNGRNDIINALLEMGADIDGQDQREHTALIWAVCVAHKKTVKLLLDLGANVNIKDEYDRTCLMYAASTGNVSVETMKRMIAMGADINAKDDSGRTSLIHAAKEGQIEAVKLLLNRSADINVEDTYGNTALEYAEEEGNEDIAVLLFRKAVENINRTIAVGEDINEKDNYGRTSLMYAAKAGQIETVKLLLDNDADINALDPHGNRALDYAMEYGNKKGNFDVSDLLIQVHNDAFVFNIKIIRLASLLLFIAYMILWLRVLVDILKNEFTDNNKITWLLIVIFIPVIGMILYFFVGKKQKIIKGMANDSLVVDNTTIGDTNTSMKSTGSSKKDNNMSQKVYVKPPPIAKIIPVAQIILLPLFMLLGFVFIFIAGEEARPFVAIFCLIWWVICIALIVNAVKLLRLINKGKIEIAEIGGSTNEDDNGFAQKLRDLDALKKEDLISDEEYQIKREEVMKGKW